MTPQGFKTFIDVQVRFRDTDAMAHVNNAVYLSYLELARMRYWTELTGSRDYRGVDFILARAEIDYRSPVTVDEEVRVWVRVCELRRSSFLFEYRLEEKGSGRLVAQAKTVQACYDYAARKVKRLDDPVRRAIAAREGLPAPAA